MEEKFTTRDYPQTAGHPQAGFRTQQEAEIPERPNAFVRFLKFVFVQDFAIKAAALLTGAVMFLLTAGLG